jgi:hypothetical protein
MVVEARSDFHDSGRSCTVSTRAIDYGLDRFVGIVIGRFEPAVGSVLGLGLMKAAVGEGSAQPFMKEEKEQGDLNPFRREAVGVAGSLSTAWWNRKKINLALQGAARTALSPGAYMRLLLGRIKPTNQENCNFVMAIIRLRSPRAPSWDRAKAGWEQRSRCR